MSLGNLKRCDNKIEAILSHVSSFIDLHSHDWISGSKQNTYGQPYTLHTHANISRSLFGYTHIYAYVYPYLWSTHSHTHMHTPILTPTHVSRHMHIHTAKSIYYHTSVSSVTLQQGWRWHYERTPLNRETKLNNKKQSNINNRNTIILNITIKHTMIKMQSY